MAVKGINGADLNNISKVDGRSNVLDKVNGVDADLSPPAVAYSVRNVSGLTGIPYDGPAMRILVDATGDGADATDLEFDINFTADGDLDVADIELKCAGGKDAYVVKWYDQSGAGNDATQTAYAAMPKIATAGTVITENGKPAVKFVDTVSNSMNIGYNISNSAISAFQVMRKDSAAGRGTGIQTTTSAPYRDGWVLSLDNANSRLWYDTDGGVSYDIISNSATGENQNLQSAIIQAPNIDLRTNGGVSATKSNIFSSTDPLNIHQWYSNQGVRIQEIIVFDVVKSSGDRTDIENNINSYFNIYQSRENILPGAAAAYSLRQLSDSSRLAIRVRRDTGVGSGTDDDEADVGFDANGELSLASPVSNFDPTGSAATTLGGFLGHGGIYGDPDSLGAPADGLVTAWYDQSVNANNATQATPESQPKIYDSSTGLITENGKPTLSFGGNDHVSFTLASELSQPNTISAVALSESGQIRSTLNDGYTNRNLINYADVSGILQIFAGVAVGGSDQRGSQHNLFALFNGSSSYCYVDGSQDISGNAGTQSLGTRVDIGAGGGQPSPANPMNGNIQEWILWNSDQDSNRNDIEGNQNAHYGIANFGTPSSGLLADYPGGAAAYSVRKLADTAGLAMRIIVDDTAVIGTVDASDTEYDIGFDANGDLDVARIREVCNNPSGANYNAYVVTWYDQSGNGNHATQATYTACPQIYDGVDVIMENGRPAVDFDGSDDQLNLTGLTNAASDYSCAIVNTNTASNSFNFDSQSGRLIVDGRGSSKGAYYDGAWKGSSHSGTAQSLNTFFLVSPSSGETYKNGTAVNTGLTYTQKAIGGTVILGADYGSPATAVNGPYQEFILWDSDKSSNRTAIETNIDSYYRIYGDPDDGLLSTPYGKGAAVAYSVRQLSNNATRAMRILVDADANGPDASDNEYDIGFDANGELDIARIEELCDKGTGNYNAYVTTWYDQSGEGNDATQATHANMPKICDAGTVILENGKPAVNFASANYMSVSSFSAISQPITLSAVYKTGAVGYSTVFNFLASRDLIDGSFISRWNFGTELALSQTNNTHLHSFGVASGTNSLFRRNGSLDASGDAGTNNFQLQNIFGQTAGNTNTPYAQEFIVWGSNQETAGNRPLIEANINDYFDIEGV